MLLWYSSFLIYSLFDFDLINDDCFCRCIGDEMMFVWSGCLWRRIPKPMLAEATRKCFPGIRMQVEACQASRWLPQACASIISLKLELYIQFRLEEKKIFRIAKSKGWRLLVICVWRAFAEHCLVLQAEHVSESLRGSKFKSRDQFLLFKFSIPSVFHDKC